MTNKKMTKRDYFNGLLVSIKRQIVSRGIISLSISLTS